MVSNDFVECFRFCSEVACTIGLNFEDTKKLGSGFETAFDVSYALQVSVWMIISLNIFHRVVNVALC